MPIKLHLTQKIAIQTNKKAGIWPAFSNTKKILFGIRGRCAAGLLHIQLGHRLNKRFGGARRIAALTVVHKYHQQQNNNQGHKKACKHHDDELFWGLNKVSVLVAHKNLSFNAL